MKALVARRYGGPDVLAVIDRPEPEVGPRDVLIAVRAASLNPLDFKIRAGKVKLLEGRRGCPWPAGHAESAERPQVRLSAQ